MRCILSFAVICSIALSSTVPSFGQRLPKAPTRKEVESSGIGRGRTETGRPTTPPGRPFQKNVKAQTKFGKTESFTEGGTGAWIVWQMESELKNAGFYVYRLNDNGESIVSDFIRGSWLTVGDEVLYGRDYHFFDPSGSYSSTYFVEAVSDKGKTLRTGYVSPQGIGSIADIPEGSRLMTETFAPKAGEQLVSQVLNVSSELQTEIQTGLIEPNPTRHREVIATPGGVKINSKADGLIRVPKADL